MTTETPEENPTLPPYSLDVLPEEYRQEPLLKDFKSWDDLLKSHVNAARMVGTDKNHVFKIPKDGDMTEVYKALGKPDAYEVPSDLKTPMPDDYKAALVEQADKLNLTKAQFEEMVHFLDGKGAESRAAQEAKLQADQEAAQKSVREAFGEAYDQTINLAKDALETLQKPQLWDKFESQGLTNDPEILGLLAEIGKLGQDEAPINGEGKRSFTLSPNEAGAEINSLMGDETFLKAYMDKSHVGHKDAVDKIWKLRQIANPAG